MGDSVASRFGQPVLSLLAAFALAACGASEGDDTWTGHRDAGAAGDDSAPAEAAAGDAIPADAAEAGSDASADAPGETAAPDVSVDQSADAPESGAEASEDACAVLGVAGECMETTQCAAMPEHASSAGYCPGPSDIQCCTPYGTALCDPSVPRDPNASHTTEAPGKGGCPAGMLAVSTFCIDEFEASLVRLSDGTSMSPYENPGDTGARAVSVKGALPQGYITQVQAAQACANAGKRLCTNDEWLRACQGPAGTTYPYGNALQLGVCNDHRDEHPVIQYFGTDDSWIWSELGNACINQLPETLDPSGTRPGCVTAEGAFDMMGNLHEWTSDPAGTFRGGFYVDTVLNGPGCLYVTTAHNTLHWDYSTGFRCCKD